MDAAYVAFDRLVLNDSDKSLGLYFRGLVLSEKRKEAQAVDDFERLQRLLQQEYDKLQSTGDSQPLFEAPMEGKALWLKQTLYEAKLNEATSRLKLYNWPAGEKAVETLKELIAAIQKDLHSEIQLQAALTANEDLTSAETALKAAEDDLAKIPKRDPPDENDLLKTAQKKRQKAEATKREKMKALNNAWRNVSRSRIYLSKLLVLCEAQLGYTHATILSFLRDEGFASGDNLVQEHIVDKDKSFEKAENGYRMLASAEQWGERERRDARFRISNARGYGRYRHAYFRRQVAADERKEETFKSDCADAIKDLEEARENRPDHYEVLQNLGMIYTDGDYDSGDFLQKAQDLFELTKRYVPDDYYQYEQLALIHWRRANVSQNSSQIKIEIDAGRKDALTALDKRAPGVSSSALRHLSRFAFKEWQQSKSLDNKEAIEAFQAFKNAAPWYVMNADFFRDYKALLDAIAGLREKSATGLVEVVEHTIEIVRDTKDQLDPKKSKSKGQIDKAKVDAQLEVLNAFAKELGERHKKLAADAEKLDPKEPNKAKLATDAEGLSAALKRLGTALKPAPGG